MVNRLLLAEAPETTSAATFQSAAAASRARRPLNTKPRFLRSALAAAFALVLAITFGTACQGQHGQQADLDALAAEMLPRIQVLSGLEARAPIRLAWQSRQAMQSYVEREITESMPPAEVAGVQAAYAAFGMIPDTLDLQRLLLELYTEQVVGYYDPQTKTLYLVEGTAPRDLRTVLAHELVHALQDQYANLDSLISRTRGNDRQTAAQAALEGQATLVMFTLLMEEQLGRPLTPDQMPPLGAQLEPLLEAQNSQFPVFRNAPRLIRETLLFPYLGGAAFVQALWRAAEATPAAYGGTDFPAPIGALLPQSTEQVLHPEQRFIEKRDDPIAVELAPTAAPWQVIYQNTLGELEVRILLKDHLGEGADSAANDWGGDYYRLLEAPDGGRALVWYSVWDNAPAADRFADAYRRILERRTDRRGLVERREIEGRPAVVVVDAERTLEPGQVPLPAVLRLVEG